MNIHEHTALLRSGFTERQISDHKQEFENLLHISPIYVRELEELTKLREQVKMLRDALKDAVAALEHRWEVIANRAAPIMESVIDAAHTKGVKALAATEPKI